MIKRPKRGETEEDLIRMQQEFMAEKSKNPKMQPAAQIVKVANAPKKSVFAKSRVKKQESATIPVAQFGAANSLGIDISQQILGEIHEKIVGDVGDCSVKQYKIADIVIGDVVEKKYNVFKTQAASTSVEFLPREGKSIFAVSMEAKSRSGDATNLGEEKQLEKKMECEETAEKRHLSAIFGTSSAIIKDVNTATEVHNENLRLLSQMKEEDILAERKRLLDSIDPSLMALLAKRRKEKFNGSIANQKPNLNAKTTAASGQSETQLQADTSQPMITDDLAAFPSSNPALELLQRSSAEHWVHFDVVEKDKLTWMRDVPIQATKLKTGEKFEARFDWKGVLLPYSTDKTLQPTQPAALEKDERELYLHGDEPHRPGYTLQQLFRLARSNVMQQRISAFGAIAGLLNIYNQGFYDNVVELPISKIFFLLRFGLDENTLAMLEVVAKALAFLFYNETDEVLLDFSYENPGCQWQPTLQVVPTNFDTDEDPTSIENLQKQMKQLQMNAAARNSTLSSIAANVEESEEDSKTSMSDFQLAETDLLECLLRTNVLQRIYFILHTVRPDNSTVSSCLKLLIRLARTGKEVATQIVNNTDLLNSLWDNFLPGLEHVDTTLQSPPFYKYPQYLCLKLMRVLISQSLGIAVKLVNFRLVEKLQNYIYNREDIKGKLIKVQIECLRILRCLQLLRVDNALQKKFLPALRYMLEWHFNHASYEVGGPYLLRQHAAAVLAAITSGSGGLEASTLLGEMLHDCCCSWFHRAARTGVQEFTQATLLSACLNAVTWHTRHCDGERFRNFHEKYLPDFVNSEGFEQFVSLLPLSSTVLRKSSDRRNVHPALPNVGAVLLHIHGPQLIVPQTYPVHLLSALWRLMELQLERGQRTLFEALLQPRIIEPLVQYMRVLSINLNLYLGTNFYAKAEVRLIHQLLCFEGFGAYFEKPEMLQLVYNFLCCLTAEHITEVEQLFERVIFNAAYLTVDSETLQKWRNTCLELVYPHYIVVAPTEITLCMPFSQVPILPCDWPYFQLQIILQNYIENVHQKPAVLFCEREVLRMTFTFVQQLEERNPQLQIATPTEKLMYLMIAFMGPDSQFLEGEMQQLLRAQLLRFYAQCQDYNFQFDAVYEGKCKFENLYALFVDHFQAASYGNELFGSLVLVPLAQKYDNKWRRRVWSDYASALRFLDCDESLLIGGLQAYLEPAEEEESLVKAYAVALNSNLVRPNSIPYKIAKYHVTKYKQTFHK